MKKTVIVPILILVLVAVFFIWKLIPDNQRLKPSSFLDCVSGGNPVMESYPRKCISEGVSFVEDIGNALEKQNLIKLTKPTPNSIVSEEIYLSGLARGYWYFEASFPIVVKDDNGNFVGNGIAQAKSEWMTENFVPFEAKIILSKKPTTKYGKIILNKDNPSGDPERDDFLIVPIVFATSK